MDDPNARFQTVVLTAAPGGASGRRADGSTRRALLNRDDAPALFREGFDRLQAGDAEGAAALLDRAATLRPDVPEVWAEMAVASLRLERFDAARQQANAALRLGLDDARLRCVLGLALRHLGRPEESLQELRRAVELGPEHAGSHVNLGDGYANLNRPAEALASYDRAARLDPSMATVHARRGAVLARLERLHEAFGAANRAAELEPNEADHWRALAELYSAVEEYAPAINCWHRCFALTDRRLPEYHRGLGWAYQEEHQLDQAEAEFRAAIALDPNSAEAQIELGFLLQEKGEMAAAEARLREAIRLQPSHGLASARLASMLRRGLPDADLERTCRLVEEPAMPAGFRCSLHFSLGQVFDARGEYPAAARHLNAANALQLASARPHRRFSPENHERFHDDLIREFDRDFFEGLAGAGLDTRRPVFVVGLPRSGTSLVEQVLASHPDVHGAGELPLGRRMFSYLPVALGRQESPVDCVAGLDPATVRRLAGAYFERLSAQAGRGHARVVDKMPDNVMFLGLLVALFPNATVIHCRRDLRDVALSCWTSDFRSVYWCNDVNHIGTRFRCYLRLMDHWREALPTTVVEVDYEAMVTDLEGNARRLLGAMGLDWHPNCLEFHKTKRPVQTSSATQVRQPLYTRSVGRWRNYEHLLADLFAAVPDGPGRSDGPGPPGR